MSLDNYQKNISKEALNEFPRSKFEGTIHLIDSLDKVDAALAVLKKQVLLGIDTETKPSFVRGVSHKVSLLQVSTKTDVFIFRLNKIGIPTGLASILNTKKIMKVGIALHDDIKDLKKIHPSLRPQQLVDLNVLAPKLGFESIGAKKLSALILGFTISKKEQTSNWETEKLSIGQLNYAATDAWICVEIYERLSPYLAPKTT